MTVSASDGRLSDSIAVTIGVTNVEEPGTLTLSPSEAEVGVALATSLDDPDGLVSVTWQWASSATENGGYSEISGETSNTYTPVAADEDRYIRVRAIYTDGHGPDRFKQAKTQRVRPAAVENRVPEFPAGETGQRSVAENTASGVAIGAPVAATDPDDGDTLTYELGGADAASFAIDAASGQLRTSVPLDYESKSIYSVTVQASDGTHTVSIRITIAVTDVAEDRDALLALYNATGGANWTNNDNWNTNAPIGQWHGVTTDSDGRVTHMTLKDNGLSGQLPAQLGNLDQLEELHLTQNQLSGHIPSALGDLSSLRDLRIALNELSGAIPSSLGGLANLETLILPANQLSGEIPSTLGNLTTLTMLWLSGNRLEGAIPAALGNLNNLEKLLLRNNQFTGCIPAALQDVPENDFDQVNVPLCE